VPQDEPMRTQIIRETYESLLTGHLGREVTYKILARDYFWPGMLDDIWRYIRNCDVCGRSKP
jgi:hypothetical protein